VNSIVQGDEMNFEMLDYIEVDRETSKSKENNPNYRSGRQSVEVGKRALINLKSSEVSMSKNNGRSSLIANLFDMNYAEKKQKNHASTIRGPSRKSNIKGNNNNSVSKVQFGAGGKQ
jgi:hypothetical protein